MESQPSTFKLKTSQISCGKCACCGEHRFELLSLDHINGRDANHARSLHRANSYAYRDVEKEGYPKDKYRVLCFNCNCSIGYFGYCPHTQQTRFVIEQEVLDGIRVPIEKYTG